MRLQQLVGHCRRHGGASIEKAERVAVINRCPRELLCRFASSFFPQETNGRFLGYSYCPFQMVINSPRAGNTIENTGFVLNTKTLVQTFFPFLLYNSLKKEACVE